MTSSLSSDRSKPKVSLARLGWVFARMGATGFGTSMLPYYRLRLVEDLEWITEDEFLQALKIAQALPGLNATNLSVILGDRLAGPRGAVVATVALILPGAISLLVLGGLYTQYRHDPAVDRALDGVSAAAAAILLATTWRVGKAQLMSRQVLLVALTAVLAGVLQWSLPLVLLLTVPLGVWSCRPRRL